MQIDYDAVIIGSGLGGLACGAWLAHKGLKVAVCEQHSKIGGYAHGFTRKGYIFESGIHSVPLSPDGFIQKFLGMIGAGPLPVIEQSKLFSIMTPDFSYSLPSSGPELINQLVQDFPEEASGIKQLFDEMKLIYDKLLGQVLSAEHSFAQEDTVFLSKYVNLSFEALVERSINNEKLRTILFSQWPYGGVSPGRAPAVFYSLMFMIHYIEGAHTVHGGMQVLADRLHSIICAKGGVVRTKSCVNSITLADGHAQSVVLENGEVITGNFFISNISPHIFHGSIIPEQSRNKLWLKRLSRLDISVSAVAVYLGLTQSIDHLLPDHINFWFSDCDYNSLFAAIQAGNTGSLNHLILLRGADDATAPTLTLLYFIYKQHSTNWKTEKEVIAHRMIDQAAEICPGIQTLINVVEMGSPATFERYTGNRDGALYGFENICDMYAEARMPAKTYISNVYQCGHWTKPGGGVFNVMASGYSTAKMILRELKQEE